MILYIYCLRDPRDNAIRYVGQTNDLEQRRASHERNEFQGNLRKSAWGSELKAAGLKPVMEVLEECSLFAVCEWERYWSRRLTEEGADLLNAPVGAIARDDLTSSAVLADLEQQLQYTESELCRILNELFKTMRVSDPAAKSVNVAILKIGHARVKIRDKIADKRAERRNGP